MTRTTRNVRATAAAIGLAVTAALAPAVVTAPADAAAAGHAPTHQCGNAAQVTLAQGSTGASVRRLQCELNDWVGPAAGAALTVDGVFGSATKAKVIRWQRAAGLTQDGVVGPRTWASLG